MDVVISESRQRLFRPDGTVDFAVLGAGHSIKGWPKRSSTAAGLAAKLRTIRDVVTVECVPVGSRGPALLLVLRYLCAWRAGNLCRADGAGCPRRCRSRDYWPTASFAASCDRAAENHAGWPSGYRAIRCDVADAALARQWLDLIALQGKSDCWIAWPDWSAMAAGLVQVRTCRTG